MPLAQVSVHSALYICFPNVVTISSREMRECGVWGPMPKMDGTELPLELAARFPQRPEDLDFLTCT